MEIKSLARIFLLGIYKNLERILFASDRVTDLELRKAILEGKIKLPNTVIKELCIGCEGCYNVCPTKAITMEKIEPVKISEYIIKDKVPKIDPKKCVYCLYCHDFCPVFSIFNEISPIHPRDVGEYVEVDLSKILKKKLEISEEQLERLSKILSLNLGKLLRH
ncbi:ferredoxin [Methanocaldococcus villosus KIN24-T80]|uniref:Ferredoxin n=1 Tax=Methanocaldococcus villosus KIN24-T80 TaxID=1069083 RepID=N6UVA2_9EURY|nr:4Fe-4S binding protein [Methanocaldococcus villosus]ENN96289.1 ferredoxin [Methanocaldococcus villosus KIN24-T80]